MNWEQIINDLISIVKSASEILWQTAVRQVYANIIADAFACIVSIILFIICLLILRRMYKENEKIKAYNKTVDRYNQEEFNEISYIIIIISAVLGFFSFIFLSINIPSIIMRIYNPNYYAIKILIELAGTLK